MRINYYYAVYRLSFKYTVYDIGSKDADYNTFTWF